MSLDDLLRDGLHRSAQPISPDVDDRLARTQTSFRRRRTARRAVLAGALALVGVAALTLGPQLLDRFTNESEVLPGTSTMTDEQAAALLQGMWVTPVVTQAQVTDRLTQEGLGEFADAVLTDEAYPTAWTMVVGEHSYVIASSTNVLADTGVWIVQGATLTLIPSSCECQLDFRWHETDGTLTLELLRDQGRDIDGVPDEAYARALYSTVPFTRS
jgi:hypothetical protein